MSAATLKAIATGTQQKGAPAPSQFNPDAWHAMQARDDQLIRDSILHGYIGKEYVYKFNISGKPVTGVSVVGARELASQYGGIKHRIVASVDKTGSLFVFKSFEPLAVQASIIPQLAEEEDFYEVVIEISDLKTGNSIQVRKKETKLEKRQNGSTYERPHFDVIAESKAFRNGILSIVPQSVIKEFEDRALRSGGASDELTIDQLREGALKFCGKHGIAINRQGLNGLTFAELQGLGSAAAAGVDVFRDSAESMGLLINSRQPEPDQISHQPEPERIPQQTRQTEREPVRQGRDPDPQPAHQQSAEQWQPSPEELAEIEARERAEAGGQAEQRQAAPAGRRSRGQMNLD